MRQSAVAAACIVFFVPAPAVAQLSCDIERLLDPSITTRASATFVVPAHRASFSVSVSEIDDSASGAAAKLAASMSTIRDALRELGLDEAPAKSTTFLISEEEDYETGEFRGYEASSRFTLTVLEPEKLGAVVDRLLRAGIEEVSGVQFLADDPVTVRRQALQKAFENARDEARILARFANAELGPALSIDTDRDLTLTYSASEPRSGSYIPVAQVEISASVKVRWKLELSVSSQGSMPANKPMQPTGTAGG